MFLFIRYQPGNGRKDEKQSRKEAPAKQYGLCGFPPPLDQQNSQENKQENQQDVQDNGHQQKFIAQR